MTAFKRSQAKNVKHAYPVIGQRKMHEFEGEAGLDLANSVMAKLPSDDEMEQATRRHVGQAIHRLMVLAVYPGRLLTANPLPRGWLPLLDPPKARTYLYPDEDLQIMRCQMTEVPLVYRLLLGVLNREGPRVAETALLRISDFDLNDELFPRGPLRLRRARTRSGAGRAGKAHHTESECVSSPTSRLHSVRPENRSKIEWTGVHTSGQEWTRGAEQPHASTGDQAASI